jgi:putative addiction module killer protein
LIDSRIYRGVRESRRGLNDLPLEKHGVSELKINVGSGYRVYYARRAEIVIVLLCGGSKSSQAKDIQTAYELVKDLEY